MNRFHNTPTTRLEDDHLNKNKKRKLNEDDSAFPIETPHSFPTTIDLSVTSDEESRARTDRKETLEDLAQVKLATEDVERKQVAVVKRNSATLQKLEELFLDAIGSSSPLGKQNVLLPFKEFLNETKKTEPKDLRLYSIANSVRVDRLRTLYRVALRLYNTGCIVVKRYGESYAELSRSEEDKIGEE